MDFKEFYKTDQEISEEMCMSLRDYKKVKAHLKKLDFMKITVRGIPGKTYYKIDINKLVNAIQTTLTKTVRK
jgi:hypothetical protein